MDFHLLPPNTMNPLSLSFKLNLTLKPQTLISSHLLRFRLFCASYNGKPSTISRANVELLKRNWLSSLSCPPLPLGFNGSLSNEGTVGASEWVIGIDPDLSGALALLKFDDSGCKSAQVFDNPFLQVSVGKRLRKRLDARSMVQLLQSFEAPSGTIAYVEQSLPFPKDGKQGWWSSGFGYGLWIGVLVASGFSVVPIPSTVWKKHLELASRSTKDHSRELAAQLFPDLSSMLKRKKDHGRAEALLIASYGKGLKLKPDESSTPEMVLESSLGPYDPFIPDMDDKLSFEIENETRNKG